MDTMHDRIAVQAVLGGKTDAFRSLVDLYHVELVRYVYGLIGDEEAAHDIAEEAFATAFRRLRLYRARQTFPAWLYQIARQLAYDDMKLNAPWVPYDSQAEDTAASDAPMGRQVVSVEVCRAMRRLRPEWRSAVQLYYWDDKTYEEIADLLGTNTATVRTWLSRARAIFRSELRCEDDKETGRRLIQVRPRLRISVAFTARVMEAIRGTRPRHFIPWRKLAIAALVLLVVGGIGYLLFAQRQTILTAVGLPSSQSGSPTGSGNTQQQGSTAPDYQSLATNAQNDISTMSLQTGKLSDTDYADTQLSDAQIY